MWLVKNIGGTLVSLPKVNSAYLKTDTECMTLYSSIPSVSGRYKITRKRISGDHDIHIYSSDFTPLYEGYFYNNSFDLIAGTLYYISFTHYYNADTSESYLQIYAEWNYIPLYMRVN